jgi:hypothetical protein
MKLIPLTRGQFAKVDDSDFAWLSQYRWRARWHNGTRSFYAVRSTKTVNGYRTAIPMHREILGLKTKDGNIGDHRDHDTLNNQRLNLRVATHSQNSCNKRRSIRNSTGFKGVSLSRGKRYQVHICVEGKKRFLGIYQDSQSAYAAYCAAAKEEHGEFAHLA